MFKAQGKEARMQDNLRVYHTVLGEVGKLIPQERVTRQRNLALLVTGMYLAASVHLSRIVSKWPLPGKAVSLTNRLRRFLDNPRVAVRAWYAPIARRLLARFAGQRVRLIIDCTAVGGRYRLLTVALAYRRRALPLVWSVHAGLKGHLPAEKQVALLRQLVPLLPPQAEVWLVGDSGFSSVPLLRWLGQQQWHFVIRQPGSTRVYLQQRWQRLADVPLAPGQTRYLGWVRLAQSQNFGWLSLVLHWQRGEEEPWYLVTDQAATSRTLRRYQRRMWIEEMYGDMKGHGCDLEATHLGATTRIERLVFAVALVLTWLLALGSWVVKRGLRHLIDRKERRDKSYFRLGWDWWQHCLRLGLPLHLQPLPYFSN
jgi:hypothetical protein